MGYNQWTGLGNLGADPELRVTPGGQAVLKLRMACTDSYLDKNNTRQERTEWVRVTVWGRRGEALSKLLNKGSQVMVVGRLQTSSYEKDGQKMYSTEVVANELVLCGGRGQSRSEAPASAAEDGPETPATNDDSDIPF